MEQINLMKYLTNNKSLENTNAKNTPKNINDRNIQKNELTSIEKRKLCNEYLIPLLYNSYITKEPLVVNILQEINDKSSNKIISTNRNEMMMKDKMKTFLYQTCLNFVDVYGDLILTKKLSEQTKKELIINAFIHSDLMQKLFATTNNFEEFEDGCYITIDLYKIIKN